MHVVFSPGKHHGSSNIERRPSPIFVVDIARKAKNEKDGRTDGQEAIGLLAMEPGLEQLADCCCCCCFRRGCYCCYRCHRRHYYQHCRTYPMAGRNSLAKSFGKLAKVDFLSLFQISDASLHSRTLGV